jgi:hypothetical protein
MKHALNFKNVVAEDEWAIVGGLLNPRGTVSFVAFVTMSLNRQNLCDICHGINLTLGDTESPRGEMRNPVRETHARPDGASSVPRPGPVPLDLR